MVNSLNNVLYSMFANFEYISNFQKKKLIVGVGLIKNVFFVSLMFVWHTHTLRTHLAQKRDIQKIWQTSW